MRAILVVLALLASASSAQALYDDVEFTNMITDGADFAGFYDIRAVDVGEPGDDTIVVRFTVEDFGTQAPNACVSAVLTTLACGSIDLFLDNPSGFRQGINGDGTWDSAWDVCERDGDSVYCVMTYTTLGLSIGGSLQGPRAISYYSVAQDYAPGGTYAQSGVVNAPRGTDYTLVGCTMIDPLACPGAAPPAAAAVTQYVDLDGPAVVVAFDNATSDDHVYNFTNDLPAAVASFEVNGTGLANATLIDSNGAELFNGTVENATLDLGNVTTGAWQLLVDFTDFNGTFAFQLVEPASPDHVEGVDEGVGDGAEGPATGNETVDGGAVDQESPGLALPVLAIGLLAFARRRL